ncbi:MAG: glycosyltransferase family 2 protein, partial [Zavarzinella sp.]|nr:glycosyltransferase family 2 protein [Zavarzinella sp.]
MAIIPQQRAPARPAPRLRPVGPHLSVVVINFCQWRNTDRLTRQLLDADAAISGNADVIVIDNDSPPDPALARLRRAPGVSLKRFDRNTGFAKAANAGCRLGRGEWVLLLNPDTAVPEGFLDQLEGLCRTLDDEEPRAGVVGLSLQHADGTDQASSGPPPTLGRTLAGLVLPRRVRKCRPVRANDRVAVPWVTGCGMLIRRACWEDLGGFDESFFLYYEDADFCRRAWANGWSVWYEPSLRVTHYSPLHTRPVPPELRLMTRHALLTYAAKYWGG